MKRLVTSVASIILATVSMFGQAGPNEARIRVVHASADAPAVDVYANGGLVVESLPFKGASGYLAVPPGSYQIQVRVAGTQTTVITQALLLMAGTDYTALAVGSVKGPQQLRIVAFGDNLAPRPMDKISLRVIHAAASAPAVDVYVGGPFAPVTGANAVLTSVPFGVGSGHLDVPVGVYQGRVTVAGTKTIAIDTPVLREKGGAVRTLVAVDAMGGGAPFEVIALVDRD
jgi:hypothetical protein